MGYFKGLLNERMSGQTSFNALCRQPTELPAITAYMQRYNFNVNGVRGLVYDRASRRFKIFRSNGEWLIGNGGRIFFSNLTAALAAKDRADAAVAARIAWSERIMQESHWRRPPCQPPATAPARDVLRGP
jgi:hypothetical protein